MIRALLLARGVNSVLRFSLELMALYALARLGPSLGGGTWSRLAWACALPGTMVLLWGAFIAPKARIKPPTWLRLSLELVIFGTASRGIAAAHGSTFGWTFLLASTLSSWVNAATASRTSESVSRDRGSR